MQKIYIKRLMIFFQVKMLILFVDKLKAIQKAEYIALSLASR